MKHRFPPGFLIASLIVFAMDPQRLGNLRQLVTMLGMGSMNLLILFCPIQRYLNFKTPIYSCRVHRGLRCGNADQVEKRQPQAGGNRREILLIKDNWDQVSKYTGVPFSHLNPNRTPEPRSPRLSVEKQKMQKSG